MQTKGKQLFFLVLALCLVMVLWSGAAMAAEGATTTFQVSANGNSYPQALIALIGSDGSIVLAEHQEDGETYSLYQAEKPEGEYFVYVNGFLTEPKLISAEGGTITEEESSENDNAEETTEIYQIECFSVNFDLYESGAAIGSKMQAEYCSLPGSGSRIIFAGEKVPAGGELTLTVTPFGADIYSYTWTLDNENSYTGDDNMKSTTLEGKADIRCRVLGKYDYQDKQNAITLKYGDYTATKVSNPLHGAGEADGINTNEDDYPANRINSYAWAMGSLTYKGQTNADEGLVNNNDYLYIGGNRNLWGGLIRTLGNLLLESISENSGAPLETVTAMFDGVNMDEVLFTLVDMYFNGEIPQVAELCGSKFVNALSSLEDNWVGQLIRLDPQTDTSKVIYSSGINGSSFRSCVKMNNALYFGGSYSIYDSDFNQNVDSNNIVKVDENEEISVIFSSAYPGASTLRAGTVYDAKTDTLIYGGLVGVKESENGGYETASEDATGVKPLLFLLKDNMDGSSESTVIADAYEDFGVVETTGFMAMVASGGIWDICMYKDKVYTTIVEDRTFSVWCGSPAKAGESANVYGWHWEKIWSRDEDPEAINDPLDVDFLNLGIHSNMQDITATMIVYNNKLYLACFDNYPVIYLRTFFAGLYGLMSEEVNSGNYLQFLYGDLDKYLNFNCSVYTYDGKTFSKDENFTKTVEKENLEYLWRFIEADGELYLTGADFEVMHRYVLPMNGSRIKYGLGQFGIYANYDYNELIDRLSEFLNSSSDLGRRNRASSFDYNGNYYGLRPDTAASMLADALAASFTDENGEPLEISAEEIMKNEDLMALIKEQILAMQDFMLENIDQDELVEIMDSLKERYSDIPITEELSVGDALGAIDLPGLVLAARVKNYFDHNTEGFDLYKLSKSSKKWEIVLNDGFQDMYNYGGRTLAICGDKLYVGTANPFYGAQIWRVENGKWNGNDISGDSDSSDDVVKPVKPTDEDQLPFTDVDKDDWFYDDVKEVYEKGLMDGISATLFAPYNSTSRAMVVTMLYRMEGKPAVSGTPKFSDVKTDVWYTDAIVWATQNGIAKGYSDSIFAPDQTVARQELAAFLYRYADYKGYEMGENADLSKYTDADLIGEWALSSMQWAIGNGIINGMDNNRLDPRGTANRAQLAAMFNRFSKTFVE